MTRVSQASPQRNKLDDCFRIIGLFYALQVSYWKSELWKALSWLYLLLPLIEPFVFERFHLLSTSKWKRAKKLAKFQIFTLSTGCYWVYVFLPATFLVPSLPFTWCLFFKGQNLQKSCKPMWCCIHNHAIIYRSLHILAGLGFSVLNFSSLVSWLLISVGSGEFTVESSWETLSIVSWPHVLPPSHKSCRFVVLHPDDSLSSGKWMDLSSYGSVGSQPGCPSTYPTSWLMFAGPGQSRAWHPFPPAGFCTATSHSPEGRCIFQHPDTRESLSSALGIDMPTGTAGAGCRDTQASPG